MKIDAAFASDRPAIILFPDGAQTAFPENGGLFGLTRLRLKLVRIALASFF